MKNPDSNEITQTLSSGPRLNTLKWKCPCFWPMLLAALLLLPLATSAQASGVTQVFNYSNGFAGAENAIQTTTDASQFYGSIITLSNGKVGPHEGGCAWYKIQQNIQAFTTDFTFQLANVGPGVLTEGITFTVQNSNLTTNPGNGGLWVGGDANGLGYAAYAPLPGQHPIGNSIAVKFDLSAIGPDNQVTAANETGLYINGGPSLEATGGRLIPENDLNPYGVNLHSGDVMAVHIVYDGSILTMTLRDTVTNAQARYSWPINIPAAIGGNSAWVGLTGGEIPASAQNLLTWSFSEGYAPELPAPGFSVVEGSYPSAQRVSISANPGATIYYTTNGLLPTSASTKYTGPISVSASELVQAIAVEAGYTDSQVATANYQIAPAGTPLINFPGGFSAASNLITLNGASQLSGSALQLTDTTNSQSSAAWYAAPVNVQAFTTNFTLQFPNKAPSAQVANGLTFTIQNQNPTSTDSSSIYVSGGPTALGAAQSGLGYEGLLNSVALVFDIYNNSGDLTGLYTNGANPVGSSIDMSASKLNLTSGNPLAVTMTYDGTTLAMTITDTVTKASFSHSWPINIPATVGGNTAYVGFTAATGGQVAVQKVLSWTYAPNYQDEVSAFFTGGNSSTVVDAYPGAIGDGWLGQWKTLGSSGGTVTATVANTTPLESGTGNYLQTTVAASALSSTGTISRQVDGKSTIDLTAPHQIAFDFRPDMVSPGMRYVLFDRIGDASSGTSSNDTWEILGYENLGWVFCNGNGQGSPSSQTSYVGVFSTITKLVAGRTYHFVITVNPATKSWTATVTDGITNYSSPTLGFRANSTTDGEFIEWGASKSDNTTTGNNFTFSLGSLEIAN